MARYIAHEDNLLRVVADDQTSTSIYVEVSNGFDALNNKRWRQYDEDASEAIMKRLATIVVLLSGLIKVLETQLADTQRPSGIE